MEELLCEEEVGFSSLEEAAEEAGFSTLEELPVLSEVPFEEEEAGFSSLEEAGLSSLEEADVSSLEEGLSSLEDALELLAGRAGRCTADRKFQLVAGHSAVVIAGGGVHPEGAAHHRGIYLALYGGLAGSLCHLAAIDIPADAGSIQILALEGSFEGADPPAQPCRSRC